MSAGQILGYAVAGGLLIIAPGPDFAVVVRNGVAGGRRAASAAGLGVATGFLVWSVAVATGLATLLAASATTYTAIKLVGVAYLIFLGLVSLRSALRHDEGERVLAASPVRVKPALACYREGLLTNVLNPKVAATFLALMPQFLPRRPSVTQLAVLSVVTVAIATSWFQVVAAVVGALKHLFARSQVRRALEALTGVILVVLGIRIATE